MTTVSKHCPACNDRNFSYCYLCGGTGWMPTEGDIIRLRLRLKNAEMMLSNMRTQRLQTRRQK